MLKCFDNINNSGHFLFRLTASPFSNVRKNLVVFENLPKLSGIAGIIRKLLDILNKMILAFLSRVCCSIRHWKFPEMKPEVSVEKGNYRGSRNLENCCDFFANRETTKLKMFMLCNVPKIYTCTELIENYSSLLCAFAQNVYIKFRIIYQGHPTTVFWEMI